MQVERTCITCGDDAALFCRLCATNQCYNHMCLHLSVAHSNNTWTKRHERDYEDQRSEQSISSTGYDESEDGEHVVPPESTRAPPIPSTPKPLCAYSEAQLREQYHFYTTQARRIRVELERRTLHASGTMDGRATRSPILPRPEHSKRSRRNSQLGKGATASYELLLSRLRAGNITLDYIQSKLESE